MDCGPQFIAELMRELYRLLGITLPATTAYHPQGDGQMEWVNQELEQYLQLFINKRQGNWTGLLPLVEFQYNNHVHHCGTPGVGNSYSSLFIYVTYFTPL